MMDNRENGIFFHELTQDQINTLVENKTPVKEILEKFKQPDWCGYPEALSMTMGCWSLCDLKENGLRTKISKEFCGNQCDCFIKTQGR